MGALCRALGVTRQGYYAHLSRAASRHAMDDAALSEAIAGAWEASRRTYGAPRVLEALRRQGIRTSRKRVARLMREMGIQYRSLLLGRTLRAHGIRPSMGSIASPWDNAPTESLISTIKAECTDRRVFETRDDARLAIFDYIEVFYNRLRMHSALGYLSPDEFEARMQGPQKVA